MALRARKALVFAAMLVALSLFAWPSSAVPESMIVVHGADTSSHLRITVVGPNIVVSGNLSSGGQVGCTAGRKNFIECPYAGAGGLEIDMGPQDDKVEILDPMPFPVTAHLGFGSDKFIGNSEADTCYPEGTIRNRCYGGGGNDICITGEQNSDCVGDGGDDYCRHGAGSDGCWGDYSPKPDDPRQGPPGNDVCYMGAGEDGCHGGPGDDRLYGGPGADQLYGESGHDFCDGGPGVGRSHGCEGGPGR